MFSQSLGLRYSRSVCKHDRIGDFFSVSVTSVKHDWPRRDQKCEYDFLPEIDFGLGLKGHVLRSG